jgi:uncharacterized membrane protein
LAVERSKPITRSTWWISLITVSCLGVALAMVGHIDGAIRPVLAFWFLLICPGMAFVPLLHFKERLTELTLAIALSLALDTLVAEVMALNGIWSPKWGLFALICLTLSGLGLQVLRFMSQHRTGIGRGSA